MWLDAVKSVGAVGAAVLATIGAPPTATAEVGGPATVVVLGDSIAAEGWAPIAADRLDERSAWST